MRCGWDKHPTQSAPIKFGAICFRFWGVWNRCEWTNQPNERFVKAIWWFAGCPLKKNISVVFEFVYLNRLCVSTCVYIMLCERYKHVRPTHVCVAEFASLITPTRNIWTNAVDVAFTRNTAVARGNSHQQTVWNLRKLTHTHTSGRRAKRLCEVVGWDPRPTHPLPQTINYINTFLLIYANYAITKRTAPRWVTNRCR